MKILMIGDVVGGPGRRILQRELKRLKAERGVDAAVVNAENCAAGSGITAALAKEFSRRERTRSRSATTRGGKRSSPGRSAESTAWRVRPTTRRNAPAGAGAW